MTSINLWPIRRPKIIYYTPTSSNNPYMNIEINNPKRKCLNGVLHIEEKLDSAEFF